MKDKILNNLSERYCLAAKSVSKNSTIIGFIVFDVIHGRFIRKTR